MSLRTFSAFYYGHIVTSDNNLVNFSEGSGELTATLNIGSYTLSEFVVELGRALNAAGGQVYTVSVNRTNRRITISAPGTFSLLTQTGSQLANSAFSLMGFDNASDKTGTNTYTSANGSGSEYLPQFILQDHVATDHWQQSAYASVNKTADGRIEVVRFGTENFLQCNIKYATAYPGDGQVIKTNATGVTDLVAFMNNITQKCPIEYMADISDRETFESIILESTPDSRDGVGYKLREMYDKGLPGYFETGVLKFRVYNP